MIFHNTWSPIFMDQAIGWMASDHNEAWQEDLWMNTADVCRRDRFRDRVLKELGIWK